MIAYILVDFDGDLLDISLDKATVEIAKFKYADPLHMHVEDVDIGPLLDELNKLKETEIIREALEILGPTLIAGAKVLNRHKPTYDDFIHDQLWHLEFIELQLRCWSLVKDANIDNPEILD